MEDKEHKLRELSDSAIVLINRISKLSKKDKRPTRNRSNMKMLMMLRMAFQYTSIMGQANIVASQPNPKFRKGGIDHGGKTTEARV